MESPKRGDYGEIAIFKIGEEKWILQADGIDERGIYHGYRDAS